MNKKIESFYPVNNNDGTYRIECRCIIYRTLLGKHPDWAKPTGDATTGFNTKYFLLIEDNIPSKVDAQKKANELNAKYTDIIEICESTGNWSKFPFTNKPIIYYK